MLERIRYVNHLGDVVEFGKKEIFVNENELRSYTWTYDTDRNKVENLRKKPLEKTLSLVILALSKKRCSEIKNRLYEIFEQDVIAEEHGRIYVGDYYLECYIIGSEKSDYLKSDRYMKISVSLVSDTGTWIKESKRVFTYDRQVSPGGKGYEYDYEYDYGNSAYMGELVNDSFRTSDFKLDISGPVADPAVFIAGHRYKINYTALTGERITVDTKSRKVTLTKTDDTVVNIFKYRDVESYIFEKIPIGTSAVQWNMKYNFTITLIEERGEPKWT